MKLSMEQLARSKSFIAILIVVIAVPWGIVGYQASQIQALQTRDMNGSFIFVDHVTITKMRNGIIVQQFTVHNLLTDIGKDLVKTDLGVGGSVTAALYIGLANATFTAGAGSTTCCGGTDKSFPASGGLNTQVGAYTSTGTGTWTVVKTFTLVTAATATIYGASLQQAAGSGEIAEALFTASVTLATSDSLQVTWSLTATGS